MIKSVCLLLAVAVAFAASVEVDWSHKFERKLKEINKTIRSKGLSITNLKGEIADQQIQTKKYAIVGLDSLKRTGNSTKDERPEFRMTTYDLNAGLGMLVMVFPSMTIDGQEMTAFARVKNNSINLRFGVHVASETCSINIENLEVTEFNDVEFGATNAEFDGRNVEDFFQNQIRTTINNNMDFLRNLIHNQLTCMFCKCSETYEYETSKIEGKSKSLTYRKKIINPDLL